VEGGPKEPRLSGEERRSLEKGIAEFNDGYFFECHDTLEDLWMGIRGPSRDFFQGLIQVAVGFYHLGNGNRGGALTLLRRGLKRLEKYGDRYCGLELKELGDEIRSWLARIEAGQGFPEGREGLPKYRSSRRA
jgi:predicted metal-dependent hydrolase